MIYSARDIARGAVIETDIAIIGSGPAGLSLARELEGSPLRVAVLESGDFEAPPAPDPLYALYSRDLPVSPSSRARGFGGTTALWAGKWKPLDAIDFEYRPWVQNSGWPISFEEMMPYYERASRLAGISPDFSLRPTPDFGDSTLLVPEWFHSQRKDHLRWGPLFRSYFEKASSVDVYLGAHLVGMRSQGGRIADLSVVSPLGTRFFVRPMRVVLASGGLENPRHLLLSKIAQDTPVGRYYMDHPKGVAGEVVPRKPLRVRGHSFSSNHAGKSFLGLRISDDLQRRDEILNSHITLEPAYDPSLSGRLVRKLGYEPKTRKIVVRNYMEQEPLETNRVHLGRTVDRFGRRKIHVHWSVGEHQKRTMRRFHELLAHEVVRKGLGELKSPLLDSGQIWPIVQDASHHMGTTRMGTDPLLSVVDQNCRVHGVDNLYVAGSSVFPTGGYSNPTATIVALAIRLADHLKGV